MSSPLVQKLQLVVDATTGDAEGRLTGLTTAAQRTGEAATNAANAVQAAAEREAAARLRAEDAAGRLRVADQRLVEVRASGTAKASQVTAAEERVAAASRQVDVATTAVTAATVARATAEEEAAGTTDEAAEASGGLKDQLTDLVAIASGAALVGYVRNAADAFLEGARTAGMLANSMNATVAQGGQLGTLVQSIGLDFDDLIEIQAEFAQKVAANDEELANIGVTVRKNADGTTNWALTLEDTLAALQGIPDATERNRLGFQYFGEEGYKQLSRLVGSGKSVKDALAEIGTPFDQADVQAAVEYDQALLNLKLSSGNFARTVGSEVIPVVTAGLNAFVSITGAIGQIPLPIGLAAGAAVLLGIATRNAAIEGGFLAGAMSTVQGAAGRFTAATAAAATSSGALGAAMGAARVAGGGLLSLVGGPLGLAILAAGAGFLILNRNTDLNGASAQDAADANESLAQALRESNGVVTDAVRRQAALSAQQAGLLDTTAAAGVAQGDVTDALLGNRDAYDRVTAALQAYQTANSRENNLGTTQLNAQGQAAADAQGRLDDLAGTTTAAAESESQLAAETGDAVDAQKEATDAAETLTQAIKDGQTTGEQYAQLVRDAANAQNAASAATDQSKAAIEAYNAVTREAVQTTLDAINAELSRQDAQYGFLSAVDAANKAVDDQETLVDEVAQANTRLQAAAISAADAAADAAVESARAAGQPLDDLAEATVRADAIIANLRENLNQPGLSQGARDQLQGIIDQLTTAKDNGTIQATLEAVGVAETTGELDTATEDRETTVTVESRNGPAVISYLDGIAGDERLAVINVESRGGPAVIAYLSALAVANRLAIITVESRGGPAVIDYLAAVAGRDRLAIIRAESRGGPAVDTYLDSLTRGRLAIINVETRGGPAVENYLDSLARTRTAIIQVRQQAVGAPVQAGQPAGLRAAPSAAGRYGDGGVTVSSMSVVVQADSAGRVSQQSLVNAGLQVAKQLAAAKRATGILPGLDV